MLLSILPVQERKSNIEKILNLSILKLLKESPKHVLRKEYIDLFTSQLQVLMKIQNPLISKLKLSDKKLLKKPSLMPQFSGHAQCMARMIILHQIFKGNHISSGTISFQFMMTVLLKNNPLKTVTLQNVFLML